VEVSDKFPTKKSSRRGVTSLINSECANFNFNQVFVVLG
jgi:hypothetical protein